MKKRKLARLAVFIMLFNLIFGGLNIAEVYALDPTIVDVVIYEEVRVVAGVKQSSFFVEFNGYLLDNIETILVGVNGAPASKVLSSSDFVQRSYNKILYKSSVPGTTLSNILGTGNITFELISGNTLYTNSNDFDIPNMYMIKVETINQTGHTSWPIFLNKGSELEVKYSNIINPLTDGYKLIIGKIDASSSEVGYTVDEPKKEVYIDTDNVPTGVNQDMIFEKRTSIRFAVRYIVKESLSITSPLDLHNVSVSPLKGTKNTIVRIKADEWQQLTEAGTKVYIGGIEALRNISILNEDGTFTYDGSKKGLEVIVPNVGSAGPYPITIVNKGKTPFPDVQGTFWASGYITVIKDEGLMGGYPDNTFRSQSNITYAEVVTILVRLLGYEDGITEAWPTGHMTKAKELGITKDLTYENNRVVTRGDVAYLILQSLKAEIK